MNPLKKNYDLYNQKMLADLVRNEWKKEGIPFVPLCCLNCFQFTSTIDCLCDTTEQTIPFYCWLHVIMPNKKKSCKRQVRIIQKVSFLRRKNV
jgi:hypothetical protein